MLCGRVTPGLICMASTETTINTRIASLLLAILPRAMALCSRSERDTSVGHASTGIVSTGLPEHRNHATLFGDSPSPGLYVDRIKFMPGMSHAPLAS